MKHLITTDITDSAQLPLKQGTLEHLQNAYKEVFGAFSAHIRNGSDTYNAFSIVYGCRLSISGGNYTITEGAVWFQGEMFMVDAVSTTANPSGGDKRICKIVDSYLTAANADPTEFTDGSTKNVHKIRKIAIVNGTSSTSGYIGDYDTLNRIYAPAILEATTSAVDPSTTVTFDTHRTIFVSADSNDVDFSFDFSNAFVGCRQTYKFILKDTKRIGINVDADTQCDVLAGTSCSALSSGALTYIATATGGDQRVHIDVIYEGFVSSYYRVTIKLWY